MRWVASVMRFATAADWSRVVPTGSMTPASISAAGISGISTMPMWSLIA